MKFIFDSLKNRRAVVLSLLCGTSLTLDAATTPQMEAGLDWLEISVNGDGSWGDGEDPEIFRATSRAAVVLKKYRPGFDVSSGRRWLERFDPVTVESLAAQGHVALAQSQLNFVPSFSTDSLLSQLSEMRNEREYDLTRPNAPEGGWGVAKAYGSDVIDTSEALKFVARAGAPGLLVRNRPIAAGETHYYLAKLPADSVSPGFTVTQISGEILVRTDPNERPTLANPFFTLSSAPVNLNAAGVIPGLTFIRIDGSVAGSYSFEIEADRLSSQLNGENLIEAVNYLLVSQNPDGGWGLQKGSPSSVFVTALVLSTLDDLRDAVTVPVAFSAGVAYLTANQQGDGGFGDPSSEVSITAYAYQALTREGVNSAASTSALAYLLAQQNGSGDWGGDAYKTALAIRALEFAQRGQDADGDLVDDIFDNCLGSANPDQRDSDGDGDGDSCDPDDDNDGLTDLVEAGLGTDPKNAYSFFPDVADGDLDFDFDGRTNLEEIADGTDLLSPNRHLSSGLNLLTYPVQASVGFSAYDLMSDLGGYTVVSRVMKYDPLTEKYLEAAYSGVSPTMTDFPISGGDGLLVYLKQSKVQEFTGTIHTAAPTFHEGPNVARLLTLAPGSTLSDLATQLRLEGDLVSIQKLDPVTGRFSTASVENGFLGGALFEVNSSESYLISFRSTRPAFEILTPANGSSVASSPLTVTGTVGPDVTAVQINGVSGVVNNGTFTVSGIPLDAGLNVLQAAAIVDNQNLRSTEWEVNLGQAVDLTLAQGSSVTRSVTFTAAESVVDQVVAYQVLASGFPPGLTTSTTTVQRSGPTTIEVTYLIQADGSVSPGTYNLGLDYTLLDSGNNPLGPFTGADIDLSVQITL